LYPVLRPFLPLLLVFHFVFPVRLSEGLRRSSDSVLDPFLLPFRLTLRPFPPPAFSPPHPPPFPSHLPVSSPVFVPAPNFSCDLSFFFYPPATFLPFLTPHHPSPSKTPPHKTPPPLPPPPSSRSFSFLGPLGVFVVPSFVPPPFSPPLLLKPPFLKIVFVVRCPSLIFFSLVSFYVFPISPLRRPPPPPPSPQ